ncbi:MAG: hypothetical protein J0I77_18920 [Rudaea sp.]|nr:MULTISPECIES: hypothetical protein [unclassified Rudaea]MBN8887806.1 hypothetical protein [Rudaea sp.]MBR0346191.1 hypothetical protein [Rudaea sp.]
MADNAGGIGGAGGVGGMNSVAHTQDNDAAGAQMASLHGASAQQASAQVAQQHQTEQAAQQETAQTALATAHFNSEAQAPPSLAAQQLAAFSAAAAPAAQQQINTFSAAMDPAQALAAPARQMLAQSAQDAAATPQTLQSIDPVVAQQPFTALSVPTLTAQQAATLQSALNTPGYSVSTATETQLAQARAIMQLDKAPNPWAAPEIKKPSLENNPTFNTGFISNYGLPITGNQLPALTVSPGTQTWMKPSGALPDIGGTVALGAVASLPSDYATRLGFKNADFGGFAATNVANLIKGMNIRSQDIALGIKLQGDTSNGGNLSLSGSATFNHGRFQHADVNVHGSEDWTNPVSRANLPDSRP